MAAIVIAALVLHAVIAALCFLGRRMGRRVFAIASLAPMTEIALLAIWARGDRADLVESFAWLPALGLNIEFRLDGFSGLMVGLIGFMGVLVFAYSWSYFSADNPGLHRFAGYLVIFAGAMFGLVIADNLILMFVFWELTSVMSYLLIGFQDENAAARASALQALLVTGLGGLVMLAGLILLGQAAGTYTLSEILANPQAGLLVEAGLVLLLIGAFSKSAQFPFHFWLPGAMAAPTPVSTYLHSATMVKAGIYLVARVAPVYASTVVWWRPVVATIAVITMIVGGWRALAQHDLKLLLANGTVSQLGFIMLLVGWGTPAMTFAGVAMILGHSAFKGALFMIAGIIDHQAHTRDIRRLKGLRSVMPSAFWLTVIGVASMAGIPPLLGYLSKETAFGSLVSDVPWVVTGLVVFGSILTTAYGIRLVVGAFGGTADADSDPVAPGGLAFQTPIIILTVLSVLGGLLSWVTEAVVGPAARALDQDTQGFYLALWHGFELPLLLSAVALAGGWLVWSRPPTAIRVITGRVPEAQKLYGASLAGLNRFADRVTSVVQNGSLPVYLGVITAVAVLVPGFVMVTRWRVLPEIHFAESPAQAITAGLILFAAISMTIARRRIVAVLLLGAVGYGVAVLFVIQGAPDLALTQLLVETLFLALFVVVLSRLPDRFEVLQTPIRRATRLSVSVGAGLAAMGFGIWAVSGRIADSLAPEFIARSEPEGGGRNVVNVILTDFRALDTLGEITVLALAAMGVMALVKARSMDDPVETEEPPSSDRGRDSPMILDVIVDMVLRAGIVFSVFLLFSGHNLPGGGFIAGLVAAACLVLRYISHGEKGMFRLLRGRADHVFGAGLLIAVMVGLAGFVWDAGFLGSGSFTADIPILGEVKLGSAVVFDIGVFGVVVGLAAALLGSLGDDPRRET